MDEGDAEGERIRERTDDRLFDSGDDPIGRLRDAVDETRESVVRSVRDATGEEGDGIPPEAVVRAARTRFDVARESVETLRDNPEGVPVDALAEDTRRRVDVTRESVERIGRDLATRVDPAAERARSRIETAQAPVDGDALPVPSRPESDPAPTALARTAAADAGSLLWVGARQGSDAVARTVRNADGRQVATWGIGISLAVVNPAIAASYPTYALLSAGMVAGMGVGAYVSSHEDTPLDDVDPLALGWAARRRSVRGAGARVAAAGAAAAIGDRVASAAGEGESRIGGVDPETVARGAQQAAERSDDPWAPVFGGGLGLLYEYAADGETLPDDEFRQLLDPDLREEYDNRTE